MTDGTPAVDAVVALTPTEARGPTPPMPMAQISQRDKHFIPDVLVITRGTAVQFPNEDTVRHHVYSFSPIKRFEIKLYVGTPADPVVFDEAGIAVLGCNIHDTMVAWVVVLDTPWFARTGADGNATLPDIPKGSYRLEGWHPALPPDITLRGHQITVEGDETHPLTLSAIHP